MWNKAQSTHMDSFKTCITRRTTVAVHNVPKCLFMCRSCCKDDKHRQATEEFTGELSYALIDCSRSCIPTSQLINCS